MWLILRSAIGLLVWPLLLSSVASLSIDVNNLGRSSTAEGPSTRAGSKSSDHSEEQLFLHKPAGKITKTTNRVVLQQQRRKSAQHARRDPSPLQPTRGFIKKIAAPEIRPSVPAGLSGASIPSGLRASPLATAAPVGLRASATAPNTPRKESTGRRRFVHQLPTREKTMHSAPGDVRLMALHHSKRQSSGFDTAKTLVLVALAIMLLGMFWVCFSRPEEEDFESPRPATTTETPTRNRSPKQPSRGLLDNTPPRSPVFPAPSTPERHPQTKDALFRLQGRLGSWVKTYEKANKDSRRALELLFRCNIIPVEEFADRYVNQDQIDEYMWIATQMLTIKSLEEWVETWQDAAKMFEESASACAAARKDAMQNIAGSGSSSPRIPRVSLSSPRLSGKSPRSTRAV